MIRREMIPKVSVLMSTYNGEKYLREQIDSILAQEGVDIQLLIRDDGSTDNTISICKEYEGIHENIHLLLGDNIGVGKSFFELLYSSPESDYYAFSDQDDVWLSDKIDKAIKMIGKCVINLDSKEDVPVLYASNQILVNEELKRYAVRFDKEPRHDLIQEVVSNKLSGCTMVMNKCLRDIIINEENRPNDYILNTRIHDTWVALMASIFGVIIYDKDGRIMYRQHGGNVVGAKKMTPLQYVLDKYRRFTSRKYKGNRSRFAQYLLDKFILYLDDNQINNIRLISNCRSLQGASNLVRSEEVSRAFREGSVVLFIKCLLGWI